MPRKRSGFNRVTASREWNLARSNQTHYDQLMAARAQIERLQVLIEAAAERAKRLQLARYSEFNALINEVDSWPEPVPTEGEAA